MQRRRLFRHVVVTSALALCSGLWAGCDAKKQTEYVAGISTQVQVPRDLKAIRVDVSVGGVIQFCRGYRVYDGKVQLPRSLGEFPSQGSPGPDPITVTVSGFTEEFSETTGNSVFDNCTSVAPKVGDAAQGTRILRRSRQPYVADNILFLPMPLKYSCFDFKGCEDESKTCKGGRCVDAKIDERKLPVFSPDLLDGTGGTCFRASQCFATAAPAVIVNEGDCTYAMPNAPPSSPPQAEGAPPNQFPKSGEGLNVEITYDGGLTREILDKDDEEGFLIPDATKPQQFRLAPGLCDLVKGFGAPTPEFPEGAPTAHRVTAVRVSGLCRAKSSFQPLCASDQLAGMGLDPSGGAANSTPPAACQAIELKPPKAALLIVADDTKNSELFYKQAPDQTVGLPLSDPAFSKTEIGLSFFPGSGVCATDASFGLSETPKLARLVKDSVKNQFASRADGGALKPLDAPVLLDGALRDAYAFLGQPAFATYYRRAVLVIGNRGFDAPACGLTPAARASVARPANKVDTYVLMLARDPSVVDASLPVPGANDVAANGGTTAAFDARQSKAAAQTAFQTIVNDLATCVYDVTDAALRPKTGHVLSYTDPIDPGAKTVSLPFNAGCTTEAAAGAGFGVDPTNDKRVFLCKDSCDAYRAVLRNASLYAAQNLKPAIAVPMFSHKAGCEPLPGGKGAGSASP